jgi:hypothetical protein
MVTKQKDQQSDTSATIQAAIRLDFFYSISIMFMNCNFILVEKYWMMSISGEIRRDEMCLDFDGNESHIGKKNTVVTYECHGGRGNQEWYYENSLIRHHNGVCLEIDQKDKKLFMNHCDIKNNNQIWRWKKRNQAAMRNATYYNETQTRN